MVRGKGMVTAATDLDTPTDNVVAAELVEKTDYPGTPGHQVRIIKDDLDAITSMDDALAILAAHGVTPVDAAEILADEYAPIAKDALVNVPFMVLDSKTSWGDYGPFVTCRVILMNGKRFRFSDGSTGIYEQMRMLENKYGMKNAVGLRCMKGLSKSTYTRRDDDGEPIVNEKGVEEKGTTFYFNTQSDQAQITTA